MTGEHRGGRQHDPARHGAGPDDGAVAAAFVSLALAVVLAFGLVIDGGGRLAAYQRAHRVASEAARSAGQVVDAGAALAGGPVRVDPAPARRAALAYLATAGASGTVEFGDGGRTITVTAQVRHRPVVLLAGGDRTVSATADVRLVRGVTGEIP